MGATKNKNGKVNVGRALIALLMVAFLFVFFIPNSSHATCTDNSAHVYLEILKFEDGFYKPMPNLTVRFVGSANQIFIETTDEYGAISKSMGIANYSVKIIQNSVILNEFDLSVSNCSQNYSKKIILTDYQYNTDNSRNVGCSQKPCDAITISPVLSTINAKSDESGKINLRIENKENEPRTIYFILNGPASDFFSQQQEKFYINANSISTYLLSYSIPKQITTGNYNLGITAEYDCYCNQTTNLVFDVKQVIPKVDLPDEGIDMYDSSICIGKQKTYTLTLTNKDFKSMTYSLSVEGIPSSWITISPVHQTINSYSYTKSSIILKLPEDAPEGTYNIGIRAKSQDGDEKFFSTDFSAKNCKEPTPAELFKVSVPERIGVAQGQNKSFSVEIENLDKVAHTFKIYFSGVSESWISGEVTKEVESFSKTTAVFTIAVPNLNLSNFTRNVGVVIKDEKNQVIFTKTFDLAVAQAQQKPSSESGFISGFFTFADEKKNIFVGVLIAIIAAIVAFLYYKQRKEKRTTNNDDGNTTFANINANVQRSREQNINDILNGTSSSDINGKFVK